LTKNGKYFLPPPKDSGDFKEIFGVLVASGAGRPVDRDGFQPGPWTPDLLADAITQLDPKGRGIELRTVQHWFQKNDRGISADNIRWLAKIFGCDDPEATSAWQVELSAAQWRSKAKRRARKIEAFSAAAGVNSTKQTKHSSLARKCEALLGGQLTLSLQVSLWVVYVAIGLLNFVLGVHSVAYSPIQGLEKQVGFLWAPTWTILPAVVLPLFIVITSELLSFWKANRHHLAGDDSEDWIAKVESYSFSFWAITIVCVGFVFGFQWFGIYLRIYIEGDVGNFQIDRNMLTLFRPDLISNIESLFISMFGFLYTALYIWILLIGLLFIYILVLDFLDVCNAQKSNLGEVTTTNARELGKKLMNGVTRCSILGLWFATCIKLQVVYLTTHEKDIVSWLTRDFLSTLRGLEREDGLLNQQSMTHFTTFLLMVLVCITFGFSMIKIQNVLCRFHPIEPADRAIKNLDSDHPKIQKRWSMIMMFGVVFFLAATTLLIGQFHGFSLLLLGSVIASAYIIYNPSFDRTWVS